MTQPEALRLADLIRSRHGNDINDEAAAELRRLHVENKLLAGAADILRVAWRDEVHNLMKDKNQLQAHRDALLEALKMIAGTAPCADNLMGDKDIARAAIKAVEGEKT